MVSVQRLEMQFPLDLPLNTQEGVVVGFRFLPPDTDYALHISNSVLKKFPKKLSEETEDEVIEAHDFVEKKSKPYSLRRPSKETKLLIEAQEELQDPPYAEAFNKGKKQVQEESGPSPQFPDFLAPYGMTPSAFVREIVSLLARIALGDIDDESEDLTPSQKELKELLGSQKGSQKEEKKPSSEEPKQAPQEALRAEPLKQEEKTSQEESRLSPSQESSLEG